MERLNKKIIIGASFFLLIAICAGVALLTDPPTQSTKTTDAPKDSSDQTALSVPTEGNHWFGSENPKITIVEFSDFECPYCKNSYPVIRQLGYKYKDVVKIVYKDYIAHENSAEIALAARCAGEQGLFWGMHDKLFASQGQFDMSDLPGLASEIGVDATKFSACMKARRYESQIVKDSQEGDALGIKGTPTFLVNGHIVSGDKPMEYWERLIEFILNQKK